MAVTLIDRSRVVARQECPRLRYLNYHWGGTGLAPEATPLALLNGISLHEAHASLLLGGELEDVIATTLAEWREGLRKLPQHTEHFEQEQSYLLEGMLRAWHHVRLPAILAEYEPVLVEREFVWPLAPDVHVMLRFDAVLRRKADGVLFIWDFKTVSYASDGWERKFDHSAQTYLYPQALADYMQTEVGGIAYEGLVKGGLRKETAKSSPFYGQKIQASIFCYAYALRDPYGEVVEFQSGYTSKKGWGKVGVWELMSAKQWFETQLLPLHEEQGTLNELFVFVPPISPVKEHLERWRYQTEVAERAWARNMDDLSQMEGATQTQLLDEVAPQHDERCMRYGPEHACAFYDICWHGQVGADPLAEGSGFVRRVPHHPSEAAALEPAA